MSFATPSLKTIEESLKRRVSYLPEEFLNAYEISNPSDLTWDVSIYKIERNDTHEQEQSMRGEIKSLMWDLYRANKSTCSGRGFIIDVDSKTVVLPTTWKIPNYDNYNGYKVFLESQKNINLEDKNCRKIASLIITEGIKGHFKTNRSSAGELGELWQNYKEFCQTPNIDKMSNFSVCRRFRSSVRILKGNRWVVKCVTKTTLIDSYSFADYYQKGELSELADRIQIKIDSGRKYNNSSNDIKVLNYAKDSFVTPQMMDLHNTQAVLNHAKKFKNNKTNEVKNLSCSVFPKSPEDVPLEEIYLILDSQITGNDHSETIIKPKERQILANQMRDFINDAEIFGNEIQLAKIPIETSSLRQYFIFPPKIAVKSGNGSINKIINSPTTENVDDLRRRTQERSRLIKTNGFIEQRPINPLLAFPKEGSAKAMKRMCNDLNYILKSINIHYQFNFFQYNSVEEIRREIEQKNYDSVLCVLPRKNDLYEQLKQSIHVPSQCVQINNTLPNKYLELSIEVFHKNHDKTARKLRQLYELCIMNLLVKHHWIPFIPTESFNYNVQIGLDSGGTHNTHAMSCLGYGFHKPMEMLIFRPDTIPIDTKRGEPIPTDDLFNGLLKQFQILHTEFENLRIKSDFDKTIFYRDGQLMGNGDEWNEKEALERLHKHLLALGWISENSLWTAVEIMKLADGWRILEGNREFAENPLAGRVCFPYEDEDDGKKTALVCTTGSQYLTQGTASPLLVKISDIYGKSDAIQVVQDIVWQSDMCFTKPDTGMKLPWVLHVADEGALQQSRSYKITGITA